MCLAYSLSGYRLLPILSLLGVRDSVLASPESPHRRAAARLGDRNLKLKSIEGLKQLGEYCL